MDWEALFRPEIAPMTPYSPGLRASQIRERCGCTEIHKLSSNENPYGPVPEAVEAMQAVLPFLNRYSDGSSSALRERLSQHLGHDESNIVVGNGSNELLRIIAQCVLRPGDECVYAWPSFIVYPTVVQLMGATKVAIPLTSDGIHDLDGMADAITERTRLVFLCNPNNPTGTTYSRDAFKRFMERVPAHVLVVVDEAYIEYVTDPEVADGLEWFDGERGLCVLRTFSKIYSLAGARVGYAIAPLPLVEAMARVREPFNVNMVGQIGAAYSLDATDEIVRRREENAAQRVRLCDALDSLGVTWYQSQTNFVWMCADGPGEIFEALLRHGVIVRDFGAAGALRIGVGSPADTDATISALNAIAPLLRGE